MLKTRHMSRRSGLVPDRAVQHAGSVLVSLSSCSAGHNYLMRGNGPSDDKVRPVSQFERLHWRSVARHFSHPVLIVVQRSPVAKRNLDSSSGAILLVLERTCARMVRYCFAPNGARSSSA